MTPLNQLKVLSKVTVNLNNEARGLNNQPHEETREDCRHEKDTSPGKTDEEEPTPLDCPPTTGGKGYTCSCANQALRGRYRNRQV